MSILRLLAALYEAWDFTLAWDSISEDGGVHAMDDPFPFPPKP
jgi:hypothetical protein